MTKLPETLPPHLSAPPTHLPILSDCRAWSRVINLSYTPPLKLSIHVSDDEDDENDGDDDVENVQEYWKLKASLLGGLKLWAL